MKKQCKILVLFLCICFLQVCFVGCNTQEQNQDRESNSSSVQIGQEKENTKEKESDTVDVASDSDNSNGKGTSLSQEHTGNYDETEESNEDEETSNNLKDNGTNSDKKEQQQSSITSGQHTANGNSGSSNVSTSRPVQRMCYPSTSGALHVEGSQLVDSNGQPIQLRGISTHGLAWFPQYVNEAAFSQFRREWNVNVMRLAMYTAEYGGYCSGGDKESLKQLIRNGVAYATAQDMYVIVDWHILSDNNPNTYKAQAKEFFAQMSKEFAGHNNVIYEICNEPNGATSWAEIKSYAEELISVIRKNDKDAVIIVGTPNWSQYVDQAAANPITTSKNIMYALHFYAATHKNDLRSKMISAIQSGLPIFVSEYGICDASGNGAIDEMEANQWVNVMNQYGVSYVAWSLSNKGETASIISSSSSKTSGFTENDLTASGKWLYKMLTGNATFQTSLGSTEKETVVDTTKREDNSVVAPQTTPAKETIKETQPETTPVKETNPPTTIIENNSNDYTLTNEEISYEFSIRNSWEADGKTFYLYDLTLHNNSAKNGTEWKVQIPFNEAVTLTDGWNGNYSVENQKITISSKEYNGVIQAGQRMNNIGFIVCGSDNLKIVQ